MHLDTFLDRKADGFAGFGLGNRDGNFGAGISGVEQLLRLEDRRARDFHFAVKMRSAVLQRLKLADQLAELFALFEIIDRHVHRRAAHADHFGSSPDAARIEQLGQH